MTQANNQNNARFFTMLKPHRTATAQQIAERLRPKFQKIPGINVNINIQPPLRIGGGGFNSRSNYEFTLQGPDTDELFASARKLEEQFKDVPELQDVNSDLEFRSPQIRVSIDRERAALYGLNPADINNALYAAYGPAMRR
ncbi:MAG: efflux RND transporter permease subunit [Acidobacteriota bacterium]